MEIINIEGQKCYVCNYIKDNSPSVIYWGVNKDSSNLVSCVCDILNKNKIMSYILVIYEVIDWNSSFSPWKAEFNNGKNCFEGCGRITLQWIVDKCIPYIDNEYEISPDSKRFIIGYSLAGLFSLWTFYESQIFDGVACCSGSLWYPGWKDYVLNHYNMNNLKSRLESKIYLSLGKKEEKTSNIIMKQVGEITRWQYNQITSDNSVIKKNLIWHDGGHFNQIEKRIAEGILWLLQN